MSTFNTFEREITREEYDEIMAASGGRGTVPVELESKYFSVPILCGYGLYGTRVYEKDGKCILWYKTGSSCD